MTKSEMQYLDSSFIGPFLLFLNQYFNTFLNEKFVLWIALVSIFYLDHLKQIKTNFIFSPSLLKIFYYKNYSSQIKIYSIIDIILYASGICLQISKFLGIYIFSLKKRPGSKQSNGREYKRYNLRQK